MNRTNKKKHTIPMNPDDMEFIKLLSLIKGESQASLIREAIRDLLEKNKKVLKEHTETK